MVGRTTFVIAHRLHTLTNVDKIFVLKDGQIVDQGHHSVLVDKQGFYKTMWDKQQQESAAPGPDFGGISKSDVLGLLDLLENFSNSLPSEVVSMLNQIRPKQTEEYDPEEDMEGAEKEDDNAYFPVKQTGKTKNNSSYFQPHTTEINNSQAYGSSTEPLSDLVGDDDD